MYVSIRIVASDSLSRRVPQFDPARYSAFQLGVADIAKGRAKGEKVHSSVISGRDIYLLKRGDYSLYYSIDPKLPGSLVFEEFLTGGEEDLVLDLFAESADT